MYKYLLNYSKIIFSLSIFSALPAAAQIIPDQSLPNNSRVNTQGNIISIDEGTTVGSNLFHSFSNFDISTGQVASFKNSIGISNIISRVTGINPSNINGLIQTNGSANLFLLNSSGIIFGPNARLNLGGSFLATTANSVRFEDGTVFPSKADPSVSKVSDSLPLGLSFEQASGEIRVQGFSPLIINPAVFAPLIGIDAPGQLEVPTGKTLGLVGNGVNLDGANIAAREGRLALGSLQQGFVSLQYDNSGFTLSYPDSPSFGDVSLINRSLLNASGSHNGNIHIQAKKIFVNTGSVAVIINQGFLPSGEIRFSASEKIEISGKEPTTRVFGGIYSQTVLSGRGADIYIQSPELLVSDAGNISTRTFGSGRAGDINLNIPVRTKVSGFSPRFSTGFSNITSQTTGFNEGRTGDIKLLTENLTIAKGAVFGTLSTSSGNGGNIELIVGDTVTVTGVQPTILSPSAITASAFRDGNAGSVNLSTGKLIIRDGGRVDSSTTFSGSAGKVTINASESIEVSGFVPGSRNPSLITSSANLLNDPLRQAFPIFSPTGDAGDVSITTNKLLVKDGGNISVKNDGPRDGGQLSVFANEIILQNQGSITASTNGGNGGNINIFSKDSLILKNSNITASARKDGPGGNININADLVLLIDKSNIFANAENAQGGNIRINTVGFIKSPDSKVTATSLRGEQFDGTVAIEAEITNFSQDPDLNVQVDPPALYSACSDAYRNTLAYYHVGTAGRPTSPITRTPADGGWLQAAKARYNQRKLTYVDPESGKIKPLERVVGSKKNKNGTVTLVTDPREADQYAPAIAAQLKACQTEQAKAS